MDGVEELVGDPRDRDVGDLELLLAQEVEQQVERAGEGVELDDEARAGAERRGRSFGLRHVGGRHEKMFHPSPTLKGRISRSSRSIPPRAGVSRKSMAGRNTNMRANSGR